MKSVITLALTAVISLASASESYALSFSLSARNSDFGDISARSYDGPNPSYNSLGVFAPFCDPIAYELTSFAVGSQPGVIEATVLSQVAHYDGRHGIGADAFGLVDENGTFIPLLEGAQTHGTMSSATVAAGGTGAFSLRNPEGSQFYSDDSKNSDQQTHMIAFRVVKDGTIFISQCDLFGGSLTFNLLAGDIIIFNEDLRLAGNTLYGGMSTDADYNDMTVLVRTKPVPEPASLLLIGAGLLGAAGVRRRIAR